MTSTGSRSSTAPAPMPACASGVTTTGVDNIDLWIGGLAEEQMPFGGMLGSTFNFVFEDAAREAAGRRPLLLPGAHRRPELPHRAGEQLVRQADHGEHRRRRTCRATSSRRPALSSRSTQTQQFNEGLGATADPIGGDPSSAGDPRQPGDGRHRYQLPHVHRRPSMSSSAAPIGNDIIISSEGDDTLYGDGGNDRLEGGFGNDFIRGGAGDDIITDVGGDDIMQGDDGNDVHPRRPRRQPARSAASAMTSSSPTRTSAKWLRRPGRRLHPRQSCERGRPGRRRRRLDRVWHPRRRVGRQRRSVRPRPDRRQRRLHRRQHIRQNGWRRRR